MMSLGVNEQSGAVKQNATAYIIISVILAIFACLLTIATHMALAVAISQQGQVQVNGIVAGPPPTQPAVINSPTADQHFTSQSITVSGTCPNNTYVQIFKNNIYAGTETCSFGIFSLSIDLVPGRNDLVAKVVDTLNQYGPDSAVVTVFYDVPANQPDNASPSTKPGAAPTTAGANLLLDVTKLYQGGLPNDKIKLDVRIVGGVSPYALYINWGDGHTDLVLQPKAGDLVQTHSYKKPGNYRITIEASDSVGNKASIQTIAIVNGEFKVAPSILGNPDKALPVLSIAWELYIVLVLAILSYWLGERHMLHRYRKSN